MKVVLAVDKFKGSLTAPQVSAHLAAGLREVQPDLDLVVIPIADGGEGTVDAAVAGGFSRLEVTVTGPTGEPVTAPLATRGPTAVVEMAAASGLALVSEGVKRPLTATSRGTGELIAAALDVGCTTIVLGIGGSACTDGGAGMLQALGLSVCDAQGRELGQGGAALTFAERVDTSGLDPRLRDITVVLASDVDNPLTGPDGAAAVYGPQKGACEQDVATLEAGLNRWVDVLVHAYGPQIQDLAASPGAGAAGGVGFGAVAVLGATFRPGIDVILELTGFGGHLADAALVITGEGSLDRQSLHGKAPLGVAAAAARAGVPTVAVAGVVTVSQEDLEAVDIRRAYALTDLEPDVDRCIREAGTLLEAVGRRVARDWFIDPPKRNLS